MDWDYDDPDDYEDPRDLPCEHPEDRVEVDILTWRAQCFSCGEAWWMSKAEIDAEMKFRCELAESDAEEHANRPSPLSTQEAGT